MAKGRIWPAHLHSTDAAHMHSTLHGPWAPAEALDAWRTISSGGMAAGGDVKMALDGATPVTQPRRRGVGRRQL
jgi:hypothetical protein